MTLIRTGFIPLSPGNTSGFDHADIHQDATGRRLLYLAHTGADRVDVIDCVTNAHVCSIGDLPGVAGVLVDSDHTSSSLLTGPPTTLQAISSTPTSATRP